MSGQQVPAQVSEPLVDTRSRNRDLTVVPKSHEQAEIRVIKSPYNPTHDFLLADVASIPTAGGTPIDILSNGFKVRTTSAYSNTSGGTYIFMAFAEAPLVGSNNVPATAR